jgi:hypothetical protein
MTVTAPAGTARWPLTTPAIADGGRLGSPVTHHFDNTTNCQLGTTDNFWSGLTAAQKMTVGVKRHAPTRPGESAFTTTTGRYRQ